MVNQMVHEELAAALGLEPSRAKTVGGFSSQIQSYGLDDRISNQEAVCSLNRLESASQCSLTARETNSGRMTTTAAREDPLAPHAQSKQGAVRLIVPGSLQPSTSGRRSDG